MTSLMLTGVLGFALSGTCLGQVPTGTIAGTVHDASGAAVARAHVEILNPATSERRELATADAGQFVVAALRPGEYDIRIQATGFRETFRPALVHAGLTTSVAVVLSVAAVLESLTVEAASPQMNYDSPTVSGVTTRAQIEKLPLNGRSFLELAKLEPGVSAPISANRNRSIVSVLAAPATNLGGARYTIDGGNVTAVGLGGSQINLSQEVVQEFQVATVTPAVAGGMTDAGTVNVVTRSGSNAPEATAFYFFRDHTLAAYPGLNRDPGNPSPFFQRQQFGMAGGGPLRKSRLFAFGSWEHNDQRSVVATTLVQDFAGMSRITSSPLVSDLFSVRGDDRISNSHTAFLRYSRDVSRAFGPAASISGGSPNGYPSSWNDVATQASQSLVGLTSVLGAKLVNDMRVSYFFLDSKQGSGTPDECPACIGLGMPAVSISQAGLVIGNSTSTDNRERRVHASDSLAWQLRTHGIRVGLDWEYNRDLNLVWQNEPVTMTLFSPDQVRAHNQRADTPASLRVPLPASFQTYEDLLRLPLQTMTIAVGDPLIPQEHGGGTRRWNTVWMYAEDTWRAHHRLTVNYGLGWGVDTNLNHDLSKPALVAPLLGDDRLGPTRTNLTNLSPVAGLVWALSSERNTILRAGAGRYYRPYGLTSAMDGERAALGPAGIGRQTFAGSFFQNTLPDIPGAPVGRVLEFRGAPTLFTGADLLTILPMLRATATQRLVASAPGVQAIQLTKQLPQPATIFSSDVFSPTAIHANVGIQRQVGKEFVVSADGVYRRFTHVPDNGGAFDANHFNSVRGPVIPVCSSTQRDDPLARCSLGPVNVYEAPFRSTYIGLLVRADKRLAHGIQALVSYALSGTAGVHAGMGFDLENWLENKGPSANDIRHTLNAAGLVTVPHGFEVTFNFSYASAPPFSAFVGGMDFNGDGTAGDLLPGTRVNAFNRSMGRRDLERLVTTFNAAYAGSRDAQGRSIPPLTLPFDYSFNRNFHTLDVRVTRPFAIAQRWRVWLIAEVFNVYNRANLAGYSGDLTSAAFGQPSTRVTQAFGSGGPRAAQVAARVTVR